MKKVPADGLGQKECKGGDQMHAYLISGIQEKRIRMFVNVRFVKTLLPESFSISIAYPMAGTEAT